MKNENIQKWSGSSGNTKKGYSIFLWLIDKGGRYAAYFLLKFVAFYYWLCKQEANSALKDVYSNKMGFSNSRTRSLRLKNYIFFGQALIDKVAVALKPENHGLKIHRDGEHFFNEIINLGKGGILIGAHLGSWDLAGQLLAKLNIKVHIVMFDGEDPEIKKIIEAKTGNVLYHAIYIKKDMSHIYEIHKALSNNELVCLHGDRFVEKDNNIQNVNFMGKNAYFPLGPFLLAAVMKAPVSFVYAIKKNRDFYHFTASIPKIYKDGTSKSIALNILEDYKKLLEVQLKKYPEQWYNYYKFWNE